MKYKERYGMLKILDCKREDKRTWLLCECDCGSKPKWIRADGVTSGKTVSCGCIGAKNLFSAVNLKDRKFGLLTAKNPTKKRTKNGSVIWECECECGNCCKVSAENLMRNGTVSCGCLRHEVLSRHYKKVAKKNIEKNIVEGTNLPAISRVELRQNNTSGATGVTWDKSRNKWKACITFQGTIYNLGRFKNIEDAVKAYQTAKEKLHGKFLEWYENEYKK